MDESNTRLRKARLDAGFKSARRAAIRHNWILSTYASHENGQTPVPIDSAKAYAKAFKVDLAWLLNVEGTTASQSSKAASHKNNPPSNLLGVEGDLELSKTGTDKSNVQFIRTPDGGDLAVLPRFDYERLVGRAAEADEDAAASRIVRSSTRALKQGREVVLPKAVADRLANGDNAVRVIREWRGMIQGELAVAVGISQNYLSEIETGRRKGPAELQKKFARALGVPMDLLIE